MPPGAFRNAAVALIRRTRPPSCAPQRHATASKAARRQCSSSGSGSSRSSSSGATAAKPPGPPPSGGPPPNPKKASLFSGYGALLESRPLATKAATSAAIAFAGDITCQLIAIEVARREGGEEESTTRGGGGNEQHEGDDFLDDLETSDADAAAAESEIDWGRTARFTFVGATVLAPALHFWYGFLIRALPGTAPATVVKRVLLDQLVFAPVFLAGFLSTIMVLDGNAAKIEHKLRADYRTTVVSNWGYWIPAQVINFRFVAPVYQVLYANFVGFFWNIYLSYQSNKKVLKDSPPNGAVGSPPK